MRSDDGPARHDGSTTLPNSAPAVVAYLWWGARHTFLGGIYLDVCGTQYTVVSMKHFQRFVASSE